MNKILFLGIGILLCWVPAKGLMCHQCLDFRPYAGCVDYGACKTAPGQKCMTEDIPFASDVRQGCTAELKYCSTTRIDQYYGAITTMCCDHCDYCNED